MVVVVTMLVMLMMMVVVVVVMSSDWLEIEDCDGWGRERRGMNVEVKSASGLCKHFLLCAFHRFPPIFLL